MPAETRLRATLARLLGPGVSFEDVVIVTWMYGAAPVISVPSGYRDRVSSLGFNVAKGAQS